MKFRVNINVADVRAEPKFKSERISQALYNEVVEAIEEKDGYTKAKSSDEYTGWIGSQFLSKQDKRQDYDRYLITSNFAIGFVDADINSGRKAYFPYGCSLYGNEENGFLRFESERYGDLFVNLMDTLKLSGPIEPSNPNQNRVIFESEKFLSAPYLWGGRSFFGIDCSGFAQTIMRRFGWELPRDSKDQASCGFEVYRDDILCGDLLFFPGHVALAITKDRFIHSSSGNGGVAYNSFDKNSPIYHEYLHTEFKTARRIFK